MLLIIIYCYQGNDLVNVSLGKVWEDYVTEQVGSGHFNNASEVVRDALRLQQERLLKLDVLRREVQLGVSTAERGDVVRTTAASVIARAKVSRASK
jgi:antitoxin ParD1/3/4